LIERCITSVNDASAFKKKLTYFPDLYIERVKVDPSKKQDASNYVDSILDNQEKMHECPKYRKEL